VIQPSEYSIYHLEDASFAITKVKERIETALRGSKITTFSNWHDLDAVWSSGRYADAVIVDLLLPEKRRFLFQVLLTRPKGLKGFLFRMLRPLCEYLGKKLVPGYRLELPQNLEMNIDPYWGGAIFLHLRVACEDHQYKPFYIYSLAANTEFNDKENETFGPVCKDVMNFIRKEIQGAKGIDLRIYAKGYSCNRSLVHDQFGALLDNLAQNFGLPIRGEKNG
jgi:hypothetical protein